MALRMDLRGAGAYFQPLMESMRVLSFRLRLLLSSDTLRSQRMRMRHQSGHT